MIVIIAVVCATSLRSQRMKRRELPAPLFTDVAVSSLELPGQTSDGCGRLLARLVQPADIVAVFGRVVLQGPNFDAFLVSELQNGEDTSKFTDDPVLEGARARERERDYRPVKASILTHAAFLGAGLCQY